MESHQLVVVEVDQMEVLQELLVGQVVEVEHVELEEQVIHLL
jgi:hypothetical protein